MAGTHDLAMRETLGGIRMGRSELCIEARTSVTYAHRSCDHSQPQFARSLTAAVTIHAEPPENFRQQGAVSVP
jgi:hypothetical protein